MCVVVSPNGFDGSGGKVLLESVAEIHGPGRDLERARHDIRLDGAVERVEPSGGELRRDRALALCGRVLRLNRHVEIQAHAGRRVRVDPHARLDPGS